MYTGTRYDNRTGALAKEKTASIRAARPSFFLPISGASVNF
jgi:hypothetical protein